MTYEGRCHCGSVNVWFETDAAPENVEVRACQCAFCRRQGAKTVSDPNGRLEVQAAPGSLAVYRFARQTADYLLCAECGCYMGALLVRTNHVLGVVNVAGAMIEPFVSREATPVSYEDETAEDRIERRLRQWTPAAVVEAMVNA